MKIPYFSKALHEWRDRRFESKTYDEFVDFFKFTPEQFLRGEFQRSALEKLCHIANRLKDHDSGDVDLWSGESYESFMAGCYQPDYDNGLRLIRHYNPELATKIPDWQDLPGRYNQLVAGLNIQYISNNELGCGACSLAFP